MKGDHHKILCPRFHSHYKLYKIVIKVSRKIWRKSTKNYRVLSVIFNNEFADFDEFLLRNLVFWADFVRCASKLPEGIARNYHYILLQNADNSTKISCRQGI